MRKVTRLKPTQRTMPVEPPPRWITPDACRRVEREFGLPYGVHHQDWEHIVSDASVAREFIERYDRSDPDADYRFALAAVAIDSADQAMNNGTLTDDTIHRLRRILIDDGELLRNLIYYWCVFDAETDEEYFTITPFIRAVWNEISGDAVRIKLPSDGR